MANPNEKFLILTVERPTALEYLAGGSRPRLEVYLLNPGDYFEGFGGSSAGLGVRKTASLITRNCGPHGQSDYETDINDKQHWAWLFRVTAAWSRGEELTD